MHRAWYARALRSAATGVAIFVVDGLAKVSARALLGEARVPVLPGITLRVFDNPAGPFGISSLWPTVLAGSVVLFLYLRQAQAAHSWFQTSPVALGLVLGGGLANLVERVLFGRVTDLLVLGELTAINLADLAILAGLAFLLFSRRRAPTVR